MARPLNQARRIKKIEREAREGLAQPIWKSGRGCSLPPNRTHGPTSYVRADRMAVINGHENHVHEDDYIDYE